MNAPSPRLTGVVVHWRNEDLLAELAAAWPRDPGELYSLPDELVLLFVALELISIPTYVLLFLGRRDAASSEATGSSAPLPEGVRILRPGKNLGFAGGANLGIAESKGEIVLILNPDVVPEEGALDRLLEGFAAWPDAAGLAPRLLGPAGEPQAGQGSR